MDDLRYSFVLHSQAAAPFICVRACMHASVCVCVCVCVYACVCVCGGGLLASTHGLAQVPVSKGLLRWPLGRSRPVRRSNCVSSDRHGVNELY